MKLGCRRAAKRRAVLKTIAVIATLDTKAGAIAYLRDEITRRGYRALLVDVGCGGEPKLEADVSAAEVAQAAGADIECLRVSRNRDEVSEAMIAGAVARLETLCRGGRVDALISVGGASSAIMASSIMSGLPYRLPKLIFSSSASLAGSHRWFGPTGITVMHCLVDVGDLNQLLREQLSRAAGAICGMVESEVLPSAGTKPMVAMTTNGWVPFSAHLISEALKDDFEVVEFHAIGVPEVFMEMLIEEGRIAAVIDLVPSSVTNEIYQGSRISWPRRLEVAGEKGLPQVVAPCLVNVISRARDGSPAQAEEMKTRRHYFIDRQRVLLWLSLEEVRAVASVYAHKLNKAVGPTIFLVPMKGWMTAEVEGSDFYDRDTVVGFVAALREKLKPGVEVREVEANIDSAAFGEAAVAAFREVTGVDHRA